MCPRPFVLTHKASEVQLGVTAQPLDIIKMCGNFQYEFLHEIEPSKTKNYGPRLNFTFRFIANHHFKCKSSKNNKTSKH